MNNIFKDACFGKAYKTRDGRKAIYHSYNNLYPDNPYEKHHNLILEKIDGERDTVWIWANDYGHIDEHIEGKWLMENATDIVSEWDEEMDEEEVNKLANDDADVYGLCFAEHSHHCQVNRKEGFYDGFKAGYHKAKER